jgi:hypothetical protein
MGPTRHREGTAAERSRRGVLRVRQTRLEGEQKDSLEERLAKMTRPERLARMRELLEPMRQYLHELDEGQVDAEVRAIDGGDRPRRHRRSAA